MKYINKLCYNTYRKPKKELLIMSKFQVLLESPIINYAMVLNKYPIIRAIELENDQDKDIDNLIIEINANFINPFKIGIKIKAKETLVLDNNIIELVPKIEFFRDLIERVPESISINIYEEGEKGEPLVCNLDIYPPNFWNGFEITPEITSAFVTPNDPYVVQIIDEATKILKEIDPKTPHFCGYQANSKTHVMNMINAIYTALLNKNITYIDPPASFGKGQKIFTCEQILSQRLGTCIDLAVLIASCLERCGLYPLIIHQDGHAYVGCWLIEYYLENPICTDIGAIEKRLVNNLNEIVLIEATALCKQIPFVAAVNVGINHIYQDADKFICAIDVYSTRNRGIVPISGKKVILESEKEDLDNKAIQIDVDETEYVNTANTKIKDKIDLWSRKLLDLSMRNKLLNFNFNRHGLPLIKVNLATLEDNLIMDKEYELVQGITVESEISINDENSFIINLFKSGKIVTLNKEHSDRMLANIYREAKNSLEEQGANNLFLAIGFLRYFEYEESNAPRYAPILLLNMEIRKSIHGYTIKRGELETQMNITLTELLRRNYGIELGDLAKEVKDDFGSDVNKIFNIIRKTIVDKPGWDVIEEAFLGNFSFNKFVLWQDLQNRKDAIKEHPITGGLVKGFHVWSDLDSENINESSLDYKFNASDLLCPVPYDSSQLLAVALTDMGKSFILHGAPGTGKSQTITNIIANALGKGKSVLFVAEKRAALDVVHNRLSKIGLKPFCLELHSDKSNKAEIMEQFQEVMNLTKINPSFLDGTSKNIQTLRNKLNAYVNALHKKRKIGFSVYEVITKLIEMKDIPAPLSFSPDLL